jgi:hypothetical protein
MRQLLQNCEWPEEYYCSVPIKNKDGQRVMQEIPVLLPHEMLQVIVASDPGAVRQLQTVGDHQPMLQNAVRHFAETFGVELSSVIPLGLHGDGVPFSAKMGDSLEQLSWNCPADQGSSRVLFAAVPKSCMFKAETMDALLSVWSWSMRCFVNMQYPSLRHDGAPFSAKDKARARVAGHRLSFAGCLAQIRGDWQFYKATFNFPSWSSTAICWRCAATRSGEFSFKECGESAPWRQQRYSGNAFLQKQREAGISPSPLWSTPGAKVDYIMVDWLHTVDLGTGGDCLGNLFREVLEFMPGTNKKERVQGLWHRIRAFYRETNPRSQLQTLTADMIQMRGKPPKLRAKAAECRYLLPFGAALSAEFAGQSQHWDTVKHLLKNLLTIATSFAKESWDSEVAKAACRRFCLLYKGLEEEALQAGDTLSWRVKPKLHLMQELLEYQCEEGDNPSLFWTYMDESWGGVLATAGSRRGGAKLASSTALNVIQRFRAMTRPDASLPTSKQ